MIRIAAAVLAIRLAMILQVIEYMREAGQFVNRFLVCSARVNALKTLAFLNIFNSPRNGTASR